MNRAKLVMGHGMFYVKGTSINGCRILLIENDIQTAIQIGRLVAKHEAMVVRSVSTALEAVHAFDGVDIVLLHTNFVGDLPILARIFDPLHIPIVFMATNDDWWDEEITESSDAYEQRLRN